MGFGNGLEVGGEENEFLSKEASMSRMNASETECKVTGEEGTGGCMFSLKGATADGLSPVIAR